MTFEERALAEINDHFKTRFVTYAHARDHLFKLHENGNPPFSGVPQELWPLFMRMQNREATKVEAMA